ncbi:MAG: ribulokinase [Oscillospiraceae bacterium]|jgi:L-ribulokinase|nr:ribulokinase [Oscillospiraceae bacterium]
MPHYTIGLDFGTLSGRALLLELETGDEIASAVMDYPHGVMTDALPESVGGARLGADWALQHPRDYADVLVWTIGEVLRKSRVNARDVVGIGVDFTSCTMIPTTRNGTPLCYLQEFQNEPHAYAKLWKHHAAQPYANKINEVAAVRGETFLQYYGGKISSEWQLPKLWQVLDEAPHIFEQCARWIEAADWIVWLLTGVETHNACCAGYKGLWSKTRGFPSEDFFAALDPRLAHVIDEKCSRDVLPLGSRAGGLTVPMAQATGLLPNTAVAAGIIDAHVVVPAVGITGTGEMLAIMGTSTCHMLLHDAETPVPGVCGVAADGILPGFFAYEAGQCCVGDHFDWFVQNACPKAYLDEAAAKGQRIHAYLREKAERKYPGESGLLALDWFNGNRSVLVDADLSGLILGLTLQTKPEDIYRALIEATAFGTRKIVEGFRHEGVAVDAFYVAGGIAQKDPMTMQIYADVLHMPVKIAGSEQAGARGAAIYGAMAAGRANGGYDDASEAAAALGRVREHVYTPNEGDAQKYDALYAEYLLLHDYFGLGANDAMKRLKAMKRKN